jgi:ribosomal protein S18 acetylase RimI-like enzyme
VTVAIAAFTPDRLPAMADRWVEAWAKAYPAIAFYRRQGFATTGQRLNDQGRAIALMAWRSPPPAEPPRS